MASKTSLQKQKAVVCRAVRCAPASGQQAIQALDRYSQVAPRRYGYTEPAALSGPSQMTQVTCISHTSSLVTSTTTHRRNGGPRADGWMLEQQHRGITISGAAYLFVSVPLLSATIYADLPYRWVRLRTALCGRAWTGRASHIPPPAPTTLGISSQLSACDPHVLPRSSDVQGNGHPPSPSAGGPVQAQKGGLMGSVMHSLQAIECCFARLCALFPGKAISEGVRLIRPAIRVFL